MKSCDLSLISNKLVGLDYNEAVLCSGLSNTINFMKYGGESLYILSGRGIYFIDELLEKLQVSYHFMDIDELFNGEEIDTERIMVILPTIDFAKIQELNSKVVQFFHTFGTYCVDKIDGDTLVLRGDYDEGRVLKKITKMDFEKLNLMSVRPLNVAFKIIYIDDKQVKKSAIHSCIIKGIKALILSEEYEDKDGGWCKGAGFYQKTKSILVDNWNNFNKVAKYVLVQSIQNGSSFFYRREFGEALKQTYNIEEKELNAVGNLWRKLSRYLKATVVEAKESDSEVIETLLNQIEKAEKTLFRRLVEEISNKSLEVKYVIRN